MSQQILFTAIRHGIKVEIVEGLSDCVGSRFLRVTDTEGHEVSFSPDQGDVLAAMASLLHARAEKVRLEYAEGIPRG